jgi:hypothetical protein
MRENLLFGIYFWFLIFIVSFNFNFIICVLNPVDEIEPNQEIQQNLNTNSVDISIDVFQVQDILVGKLKSHGTRHRPKDSDNDDDDQLSGDNQININSRLEKRDDGKKLKTDEEESMAQLLSSKKYLEGDIIIDEDEEDNEINENRMVIEL